MDRQSRGLLILLGIVGLLIIFNNALPFYTDWLWYQEVGFERVFVTKVVTQSLLGLVCGLVFFAVLVINIVVASRGTIREAWLQPYEVFEFTLRPIHWEIGRRLAIPAALLASVFAGLIASSSWDLYLRYRHSTPFGVNDPLYGQDIGFYLFQFPAVKAGYSFVFWTLIFAALFTAALYFLRQGIQVRPRTLWFAPRARAHMAVLIGLALLLKAYGYRLAMYDLLYSPRGVAFGASYADVHANLPALNVLVVLASLAGLAFLATPFLRGWRVALGGLIVLVGVSILGQGVYPSLLQRFRVTPNEIVLERPYIEMNVKYTRLAYGLDKIEEREFPAEEGLTREVLARNDATVKNIRLWDHRPLLSTYGQVQAIRTYYDFVDVDNDRYRIDGEYRQVSIAARELNSRSLPSRIWINEHLVYTHGYGVVVSPVNTITREGLPEFFIKDIPPRPGAGLKVTRPELYYGEVSNEYAIVGTKGREFDYPSGDQNVYTSYQGRGGVPIGSLWRKALFAARFQTTKLLLSQDITPGSRIMYYRRIQDRVEKAAPFLKLDRDPYIVVSREGRLFWIVDAYTSNAYYPYSEPTRGVGNYIRNSVKAVVDAYQGSVDLYISDPADPVIRTYDKIYPGILKPLSAMPEDLRAHVRYPQDLFIIQARIYRTYHMEDPQVFYNKEDLWQIPRMAIEGREQPMEPYYTIIRLPGEPREEFILILPFTPNRKENLAAWLAARSDEPHYGKLVVYNFPKQKLVFGPNQVDARINQDAEISKQLSLWGQRGSQIIRGNLLAIPIERSLLYVSPLYLAAEKGQLPELKRIILAYGSQIAMEETLEASLTAIFGGRAPRAVARADATPGAPAAPGAQAAPAPTRLAAQALEHYRRAQSNLREGNWAAYGEELKKLEGVLKTLSEQDQQPRR
ncbi:MAG: UPF0182 family protein [Deltaproteobacteria bacterium]|nr:UPF0182 family protein [Deltaproteobacteria bacterium]